MTRAAHRALAAALAAALAPACAPAGAPLGALVAAATRADVPLNFGPRLAIGECVASEYRRQAVPAALPAGEPGSLRPYRASAQRPPRRAIVNVAVEFHRFQTFELAPTLRGDVVSARRPLPGAGCDPAPSRPAGGE